MYGPQVRSLVGELRFHRPLGTAEKKVPGDFNAEPELRTTVPDEQLNCFELALFKWTL